MRVLAIDAATEACSVALDADGALIARYEEPGRGHAERILGMVDEVLAEAGIALGALDVIAAGVGPGGFTGVRIAVAVAQGLAYGAGLPVVAVSTLEALSLQLFDRGASHVLACLDARMSEVYWACFAADSLHGLVATAAPAVGPPAEVQLPGMGRYRGIGRGFAAYPALLGLRGLDVDTRDAAALPHAREIARLGLLRLKSGHGMDPAALAPVYLRDHVAMTVAERRGR